MSMVDMAFANAAPQGVLGAPIGPQQPATPAPTAPMGAAPQQPGILGSIGQALSGILGLPGKYAGAIGSALSDVPDAINAQRVARDMALRQAQTIYQSVLAIPDPQARQAALFNLPEYGKAMAQNFAPQAMAGGTSTQFGGPTGPMVTAPLIQTDDKSGAITSTTPQGVTKLGQLGGDYGVQDGVIASHRTGQVAGTYAQPEKLAPGESLQSFSPGVNGSAFSGGGQGGSIPAPAPEGGASVAPEPAAGTAPASTGAVASPSMRAGAVQVLSRPTVKMLSPADQLTLLGIGYSESRLNPNAPNNGQSRGLFQMQPKTFSSLSPTGDINNPGDQADASAKLLLANKAALTNTLGTAPTPSQLYLAAMQGATGSAALLKAQPGVTAAQALASIRDGQGNPIMTPAQATERITRNGGTADMPASDFVNLWDQRFNTNLHAVHSLITQPQGAPQTAVQGVSQPAAPAAAQTPSAVTPGAPAPQQTADGSSVSTLVPGKTNTVVSPQEAASLGLPPGVWQRDPTGKLEQPAPPPKDDLDRVASLNATVTQLRALTQEQQAFLAHNGVSTGLPYADVEVHGHNLNPVAGVAAHVNPDIQAMEASSGKQLFMVKPANAGARILQSELPYWETQTQSVGNKGPVNQNILTENAQKLTQAQAQASFFQTWLYSRGNLNGADGAFDKWWSQSKYANPSAANQGQSAQPAQQRLSPEDAMKLPSGTSFVGLDGVTRVRH